MSSPVNLLRDMVWCNLTLAKQSWNTVSGQMNSNGVVHQDVGLVWTTLTTGALADSRIGIYFTQPTEEAVPYRVKLWSNDSGGQLIVTQSNGTITGTNDTTDSTRENRILVKNEFDEVIVVKPDGVTNPLCFAFRTTTASTQIKTLLSVQRLNVATPRFSSSVS